MEPLDAFTKSLNILNEGIKNGVPENNDLDIRNLRLSGKMYNESQYIREPIQLWVGEDLKDKVCQPYYRCEYIVIGMVDNEFVLLIKRGRIGYGTDYDLLKKFKLEELNRETIVNALGACLRRKYKPTEKFHEFYKIFCTNYITLMARDTDFINLVKSALKNLAIEHDIIEEDIMTQVNKLAKQID